MRFVYFFLFLIEFFVLQSCINTKKAIYFNNRADAESLEGANDLEPVIQSNDILSISVSSLNQEATVIFNTPNITSSQSSTPTGSTAQISGYLVGQDGYIQFPYLGNIKAAGVTKKDLKESITAALVNKKLLLNPIVQVRYLNFKISVLGEVNRPSVYTIPNERINLLEALALAGDLTIYGKRDQVWLIREMEGKKTIKRLNLTTNELFNSPYYYLKSNDIVYVEPNKSRVASAGTANLYIPVILSALSIIFVTITTLVR